MKITAADLKKLGVIDEIIPEARGGAHRNILKQSENIDLMIRKTFEQLNGISKDELIENVMKNIYENWASFVFKRFHLDKIRKACVPLRECTFYYEKTHLLHCIFIFFVLFYYKANNLYEVSTNETYWCINKWWRFTWYECRHSCSCS